MAKHLNLSVSTVSRCLNNYPDVNPETRRRIFAAVEELNYVPNAFARNISRKSTRTVGLTIPDIQDPFFPANAEAVETVCREQGYQLIYGNLNRSPARLIDFITRAVEMRLDGLIITPDIWGDELAQALARAEMPAVALRRKPPVGIDIPYVDSDHYGGACEMVEHLVALGHKRIGHVAHPATMGEERKRGYLDVMQKHGLAPAVAPTDTPSGRLADSILKGRRAAQELLEHNPGLTAIFAASDVLAMGVREHCDRRGIRVPDDVSISGFDNMEYADFYWFQLTTMAIDRRELGIRAATVLLGMIDNPGSRPDSVLLRPALTIRGSTKATT